MVAVDGGNRGENDTLPAFGPFDPSWSGDPHPLYADLRREKPISRSELGFWVLARHADCLAVLHDRRTSSDGENADPSRLTAGFRPASDPDDPLTAAMRELRPFLFRDPPDHTRLRGLVAKAFTPRVVESLRRRTEEIVDELLDKAIGEVEVDLIETFAYPLPVQVICELLGVPLEDQERFRQWSAALARGLDPDFLLTEADVAARRDGVAAFAGYFFKLLASRRAAPGDDLLSRLVASVDDDGTTLSEGELLSTCILLLVAGHETTVNLISGGVLALLDHPEQLARWRAEDGVARTGVEEMLRFVSPVQFTGRTMLEDLEVSGVTLERGDFAILLLASANRDEDAFDRPERFDLGRAPNNHLGFGFGIHHCLGAPLARMEAQVALDRLVRRCPDLAHAPGAGPVTYRSSVVLRGPETLSVRLRN